MKRRVFNEFNRRVKLDVKRYHRVKMAAVSVLEADMLYERAYRDFVETRMVSHAFFFVFYRRLFNQYWLDMRNNPML